MTSREIAAKSGFSESKVRRWLNGSESVPRPVVPKLAKAIGGKLVVTGGGGPPMEYIELPDGTQLTANPRAFRVLHRKISRGHL